MYIKEEQELDYQERKNEGHYFVQAAYILNKWRQIVPKNLRS